MSGKMIHKALENTEAQSLPEIVGLINEKCRPEIIHVLTNRENDRIYLLRTRTRPSEAFLISDDQNSCKTRWTIVFNLDKSAPSKDFSVCCLCGCQGVRDEQMTMLAMICEKVGINTIYVRRADAYHGETSFGGVSVGAGLKVVEADKFKDFEAYPFINRDESDLSD